MQITKTEKGSVMRNRLAIGIGTLTLAVAVTVGSLEWMAAQAASQQLEGAEQPAVALAPPSVRDEQREVPRVASVESRAPEVRPAPRVDSSVESYRAMRARL